LYFTTKLKTKIHSKNFSENVFDDFRSHYRKYLAFADYLG